MTTTDWRKLCAELTDELSGYASANPHHDSDALVTRARAALATEANGPAVTEDDAFAMGQIGGRPSEAERLAFEAWMRGHSWLVAGTWNGVTYDDRGGNRVSSVDHDAMQTRMLWAAWRDRAALAEPVADGPAVPESREPASVTGEPTDEELLELMPETMRDEFSYAAKACSNATGGQVKPGIFRVCLNSAALEYARAVLARFGHQPAPPAEGEVGELVEFLRIYGDEVMDEYGDVGEHDQLTRAAELLSIAFATGPEVWEPIAQAPCQRHPTPVPVSERLPEARDCLGRPTEASDAGWCWTYSDASERWSFQAVVFPRSHPNPPLVTLKPSVTHWLPHYALPLPALEVE